MKKIIWNCATVQTEDDFWHLYCEVIKPQGQHHFGRNLQALWDALSAGAPGWPGECQIELIHVDQFAERNPFLYSGLQRIAKDLSVNAGVQIFFRR